MNNPIIFKLLLISFGITAFMCGYSFCMYKKSKYFSEKLHQIADGFDLLEKHSKKNAD